MNDPVELWTSREMQSVRELIAKVAEANVSVLLRGESGVGKELVARAIHHASPRADKVLLKINCAAMPGELLESELFGHQKGAFTGAYRDKPGKFEVAHGGTLMLDEIGEMPLRLQAKPLHVLQDGESGRVGGDRITHTDVRVIAATNRDLEAGIRAGQFREDLYYRLNVIEVRVPPLRERREEIPALVGHFMKRFQKEYGSTVDIPTATLRAFMDYAWPGNVRELENVLKRIVVLGDARVPHEIVASLANGTTTSVPPTGTATSTLGSWHSATELRPLDASYITRYSVLRQRRGSTRDPASGGRGGAGRGRHGPRDPCFGYRVGPGYESVPAYRRPTIVDLRGRAVRAARAPPRPAAPPRRPIPPRAT